MMLANFRSLPSPWPVVCICIGGSVSKGDCLVCKTHNGIGFKSIPGTRFLLEWESVESVGLDVLALVRKDIFAV